MSRVISKENESRSRGASAPAASAPARPRRRGRLKVALLVLALIVVVGLGAAWYEGGGPSREWSLRDWWQHKGPDAEKGNAAAPASSSIQLLPGTSATLVVPREMKSAL